MSTNNFMQTDGSDIWKDRVNKLVRHGLKTFFHNGAAVEPACETYNTCTTDMKSFRGYLHRWYATTTKIAPFTADQILPVLEKSAQAAVDQCTGGDTGRECGFSWTTRKFDNDVGAGQEMNVLAAVSSLLIDTVGAPVTHESGGTSKGNPNAGAGDAGSADGAGKIWSPVTTGDRAGAGIITFILLGSAIGLFGWMNTGK